MIKYKILYSILTSVFIIIPLKGKLQDGFLFVLRQNQSIHLFIVTVFILPSLSDRTTDDVQMKEQRCSWIISIMTNAIYQEQCKLVSGLAHAFLGLLNNGANTSKLTSANLGNHLAWFI